MNNRMQTDLPLKIIQVSLIRVNKWNTNIGILFPVLICLQNGQIDPFHIVISLSNRSSIEKSIKPFLKMKGQIA